ncbi:hypothetical protein DM860_001993 [Cuscuta australis]|uniref:Uncharacterized protein n=1 Tax=Cuscuta australis TaxID=267555 RepID=A0A328DVK2_9ASTE|nr:hypothetical protein DM860_001993 [Cuscuta australis]
MKNIANMMANSDEPLFESLHDEEDINRKGNVITWRLEAQMIWNGNQKQTTAHRKSQNVPRITTEAHEEPNGAGQPCNMETKNPRATVFERLSQGHVLFCRKRLNLGEILLIRPPALLHFCNNERPQFHGRLGRC